MFTLCVDVGPAGNPAWPTVDLVRRGKADFLMKGKIDPPSLLIEVVDRDSPLRTGALMLDSAFLVIPSYHKLLAVTDGVMVIRPDLEDLRPDRIRWQGKSGCQVS